MRDSPLGPFVIHQNLSELIEDLKKPLFIVAAETDNLYTSEMRQTVESTLKSMDTTYFCTLASHIYHGFCTRGDLSAPMVKFAKEKTFRDCCEWFHFFSK